MGLGTMRLAAGGGSRRRDGTHPPEALPLPLTVVLLVLLLVLLPADLHWFELDQADVVAAKQKLLGELAAEVPPQGVDSEEAQPGTPGQSGLTRHLR